ncbi:unnamed protein product [Moneuplotes crassus]|uniref:Prefoldin subunit 1 n=1 Tax=Euplotes crassus TaxID=5936 RepID=A0AAD2D8N2_EUPCR|nr:unnamed protein product [Moneuplotes crassus]
MATNPDPTKYVDKNEVMKCQKAYLIADKQVGLVHESVQLAKTALQKNEITKRELEALTDHKVYKAVGRMFVLSKGDLKADLEAHTKDIQDEMVKYDEMMKTYKDKRDKAYQDLQNLAK